MARPIFVVLFAVVFTNCGYAQPNVLWIVADDLSPDLGAYGNLDVQTPNLDRLASEGVRYDRAYSTSAVCSASRSALITGMYQTSIGAHSHRMTASSKRPLPAGVSPLTEYFRQQGYYVTNSNASVTGGGKTDYNFLSGVSGGMYDGFDWAARANGQPFFAQVQIFDPHRDFRANTDSTRLNNLTIPSYYPDHEVTRADWANYLTSVEELDRKVGLILDRLDNEGLADNTVVMFMGDHGRPHVRDKQWLYDGGLRVPLIVRDPTQANAGTVSEEAVSLIDVGVGSLALTGATLPGHLQGVNMFDAGFDGREAVFAGRDRSGNVIDRVRSVQVGDLKLIRNYDPSVAYMKGDQESFYKRLEYPVHTLFLELEESGQLTPQQAQFLANSRAEFELYDLSTDPEELNNLADDPAYATVRADLASRLDTWVSQTDGAGFFPNDPLVEMTLQQNSINWGTNQLANRGFQVNGDRTLELRWWEERLGVQTQHLTRDTVLHVGSIQADGLPPNGGSITVAPFTGTGAGVSPATGGEITGSVVARSGSTVSGVGRISRNLTAESGAVIQVGGDGITTAGDGTTTVVDFESAAVGTVFANGAPTGQLAGWSFVDLAPSNGTTADAVFEIIDTASDGRWTQSTDRSQILAQTANPIDFLRENDTSGETVAGALALAAAGSGIDTSSAVDVIEADLVWGDALGDGSDNFLDSKLVFGFQDPDNFISLAVVKGQASGNDTQVDIRAIVDGQVVDAFHARGSGSFHGNFPDSGGPGGGMIRAKVIHDSSSGFVFFSLADADDPNNVFATATVADEVLRMEGLVGFGLNNDAGAWDNLQVTTQSALPATGRQQLTLGGDFDLATGAVLKVDLFDANIFDQVVVADDVNLAGALMVNVMDPTRIQVGDTFTIIEVGDVLSGTFSGLPEGALVGTFGGNSLAISYVGGDGNDIRLETFLAGDFDRDGQVGLVDVDLLVAQIASGQIDLSFDLNGDGLLDVQDLDVWRSVAGAANLGPGISYLVADANLDGVVDGLDFILWNDNKFTDIAAWSHGDFNADGVIDGVDFIEWNDNKFQNAADSPQAVPEPTVLGIWMVVSLGICFCCRRTRNGGAADILSSDAWRAEREVRNPN